MIREALGIKHGIFAVDCDITPGYLTNIEKGHKQPSPAVAVAMARRLGVDVDSITYTIPDCAECARRERSAA
ncbi:transcriptional regulator [Actinotalea ferrariae CF5-4]|uniref:Transcriptional regulator n=1 Tax=Actinotalea ferrariae CF5-4 TaxID=948458 RepID=A0A021VST4_9CELL|nr:transcriptional regulator [Actinotalea ferrariae CF5-4]